MEKADVNCIVRLRVDADGEGVRSVIFLQGCPLSCLWCCNPETRFSKDFRTLTAPQLYHCIRGDIPYFVYSGGGVTFSGGEPLLQADFLAGFINAYCEGFHADIETSLHAPREALEQLIPLIDTWNVDFKVADAAKHKAYTGVSNETILHNLRLLAERIPKEKIIITYPVIPGFNDAPEQVEQMMAFLREIGVFRIELHPYRKWAEAKHCRYGLKAPQIEPLSPEQERRIRTMLEEGGFTLVSRIGVREKEKCAYLKDIRKTICRAYNLPVEIAECTVTERCAGTCPRCERELEQIGDYLDEMCQEENDP